MKFTNLLAILALIFAVSLAINSSSPTTAQQNQGPTDNASRTGIDYATLTTVLPEEDSGEITMIWNDGTDDIIGRSNNSVRDALRQLNSRLGGNNSTRTNLSVLLDTVGESGWRLIQTEGGQAQSVRIFMRNRIQ